MANIPHSKKPPVQPIDASIVALTHYLPPYMAGVFRQISRQTREFRVLLSIDQEPNREFGNTWERLDVSIQKSWMLRRPWKHAQGGFQDDLFVHFPIDTFVQLRRLNPDIVFSFELGFRSLMSALYCRLYRKRLALCVCVSQRTEQGRGMLRHVLRRVLVGWADAITYNGPSCLAYLKQFRIAETKLFHFPYAASDQFDYSGSLERHPRARRRLMVIGQLTARKGILPLMNSLIEYCKFRPKQKIEVDFVGRGNLEADLRTLVLPENLQIQLLGSMGYAEIAAAMENCGVLVFPTLADEWGLVVNEAMQAGMPVIGSEYAQACTTLIAQDRNGWLYCPDAPNTLFIALDKLFSCSEAELHSMRAAAQETVKDITPENVAAAAISMFQNLLMKENSISR